MKAIGNYRVQPVISNDRRLAQIVMMTGPRASIRFIDGTTYAMAAEPLRKVGLVSGDMFILITEYRGREVAGVRVERQAPVRGGTPTERAAPKIMVRDGLKVTTRR